MECIIRSEYCRRLAPSYHREGPSDTTLPAHPSALPPLYLLAMLRNALHPDANHSAE